MSDTSTGRVIVPSVAVVIPDSRDVSLHVAPTRAGYPIGQEQVSSMSWSADLLGLLIASRTLGGGTLEGTASSGQRRSDGVNSEHGEPPDCSEPRGTTQPQAPRASKGRARAEKKIAPIRLEKGIV